MLVIADNLIRTAGINLRKIGGAAGNGGEVFHQSLLLARSAYALMALAQSLQDGLGQIFAR